MNNNKYLEDLLASLDPNYQKPEDFRMQGVEDTPVAPIQAPKARMPSSPAPSMAQPPVDPQAQGPAPDVKQYIMQKYNLGDYSDDNRKKILEENSKYDLGGNAKAALMALGAGLQGQNAANAGMNVLSQNEAARKSKLDDFDKARGQKIQQFDLDRNFSKAQREDDLLARESDVNSEESKLAQSLAKRMAPEMDFSKMSATQINQKIPSLQKIYEIEQKKLDRQEARDERRFQNGIKISEKQKEKAKPSDKQIEAFTDLDNAESDLNNLLNSLGDKSNWTGPVDGRVPDMLVGDNQVAWRSAVGKYKDAYRKAITGAGASNDEIARLEKRLPSETDTFDNFKSKANESIKELQRKKQMLAKNLTAGGKDVSNFVTANQEMNQFPKQVRKGNQVATVSDEKELKEALDEGFQ